MNNLSDKKTSKMNLLTKNYDVPATILHLSGSWSANAVASTQTAAALYNPISTNAP